MGGRVKSSILLTGATGALGSALLQRLAKEGYDVICLVRAANRGAASERIEAIIGDRANVRTIVGDVTEPQCGISDVDADLLVGRVKHILHCAASINFQDKAATQLTNIAGLRHVLELTDILATLHLLHVSTAYVVGDGTFLPERGISNGEQWRNAYEESKSIGETMVRAWAANRPDWRFTILRPSSLIGAEDGTTSTFDGYYQYLEPIHRAAESLRRRNPNALPPDVTVSESGLVRLPLAVLLADQRINYIPIDWVADMIVAAIDVSARNQTYNLVHPNPPRKHDCLFWSLDYLKVSGVSACESQGQKERAVRTQSPLVNRIQRRVDAVHDAFAPYCLTDPDFEMERASRDFGTKFRLPPAVDRGFLERTLEYAIQNNWGSDAGER